MVQKYNMKIHKKKCKLCDVSQKSGDKTMAFKQKKVTLDKMQTNYAAKRRFKSTRNDPINETECLTAIGGKSLCVCEFLLSFERMCVDQREATQSVNAMEKC